MATAQKTETGWDHAEKHKPEPNPKFSGMAPVSPTVSASAAVAAPPAVPVAAPPVVPVAAVSSVTAASATVVPVSAPTVSVAPAVVPATVVPAVAAPAPKLTLAQRIKAALERGEEAAEKELESILEGK